MHVLGIRLIWNVKYVIYEYLKCFHDENSNLYVVWDISIVLDTLYWARYVCIENEICIPGDWLSYLSIEHVENCILGDRQSYLFIWARMNVIN